MTSLNTQNDWRVFLKSETSRPYFQSIKTTLIQKIKNGTIIYPMPKNIFRCFELCSVNKAKVVILGQDPYHQPGQANGLCFSVDKGIALPPSLRNIFAEISTYFKISSPVHGDLTNWAEQGVLLLNTTMTVEPGQPNIHKDIGWGIFTDAVISYLSQEKDFIVFLLWGSFAQSKHLLIDKKKHAILTAPHPSPLSAYRGFFGCEHFSATNMLLKKKNLTPIDWSIKL